MLTDEQRYENKQRYLELLSMLNFDMTDIIKYLDSVDFFEKPLTDKHTGSYAGALCEYALKFCHELGLLASVYYPDTITQEDVLTVGLLRNLSNAETFLVGTKNVKNEETGKWDSVLAYKYDEDRTMYGDGGLASAFIASKFVKLTEDQALAIIHGSKSVTYTSEIYGILEQRPLVTLTRMADLAAAFTKGSE